MKCSAQVWRKMGWRGYMIPCPNKAKFERDGKHYCGVHDPVAKAERAKRRGPTRFERELEDSRKLRARLAAADELAEAVRNDPYHFGGSRDDCAVCIALAKYEEKKQA